MQQQPSTSLSRKGYGIVKAGNEREVEELRKMLTVKPKINPEAPGADLVKPFPVYKENSTKLYMPVAFGYERYGEPGKGAMPPGIDAPGLVFSGRLRPEQDAPVSAFVNSPRGGIISLQCAAGKTVMALYIAAHYKKKTLVVCHKNFLIDQWRERIAQFIPTASVGLIKAKVIDVEGHDIVLASLQSIAMKTYDPQVFHGFHLSIIDEVHHTSAEVFSRALPKIATPVMLGLSATLNRKDGLRKVFEWHIGKPVYENQKRSDNNLIVKMVKYYTADPDYSRERLMWNGKRNTPQMLNAVCGYKPRNDVILDALAEVLKSEPGRHTIILSDRRNHLTELSKQIEKRRLGTCGFYVGGMKPEELKKSESKDIILGTYTLVSEGFDVPSLNTLVFASPISSIEQSVGRIQRQKPADRRFTPLIIDIWDDFSLYRNQGFRRIAFYKKNGYTMACADTDGFQAQTEPEDPNAKVSVAFIEEEEE
jgi:superfamily II DNA or RNA helicase